MKIYIPLLALLLASLLYPQSKMDINNLIDRGGFLYAPNKEKPFSGSVFDFYDNGQKKLNGRYRNGIKNGKWKWWNDDGGIDSTGSYKNSIKNGLWTYYTEIGNGKYEVKYTDGIYNMAVFTDSFGNDYTGSIAGEPEQDGIYIYLYDFSKFPELFATVKDREADGLVTEWYENGQKSSERTSKDGKENGLWTEWYENGQKEEEGTWKDGERDGLHTRWSPNGKESSEVLYNDGKQDGLRTYWYANGQKWYERTYKDGEKSERQLCEHIDAVVINKVLNVRQDYQVYERFFDEMGSAIGSPIDNKFKLAYLKSCYDPYLTV